ncbi:MAG TPA: hypothetical protein VKA07_07860 [Candidatus Sulfotelmatobacter sp.]|nr:hypothetical protein [Candidatus Sulfotelmatobacter sp.]
MNQEQNPVESNKQKYEPPKVVTISLRPEEAVLGHCKTSGSAGPTTGSCVVLFCSSIGS